MTSIGGHNTAVADLTGGLSRALPILNQYAQGLDKPVDALKSLRLDGLLPAIPLTERFGTVLEAAGNQSKNVAGEFQECGRCGGGTARGRRSGLAALDLGANLGERGRGGFAERRVAIGALQAGSGNVGGALAESAMKGIAKGGAERGHDVCGGCGRLQGSAAQHGGPVIGVHDRY